MAFSTKLALFAFLNSVRSISLGRNLRAFFLRRLLLWPRIFRSFLKKVCSWYFQTSSADEKKTRGDTGGPSSTEMMRKREDRVVVCASRDLGGGEPSRRVILGSSDAEQSFPLEDVIPWTPSMPHSLPSSHAPSPQGSPIRSATRLPLGSPRSSASSLWTGSIHDAMELFIHRSDTPVTPASWTHSHAAGRQFTGASSHGRNYPRPSSPFLRHFSRPSTPRHDIETRLTPTQHSQGFHEGSSCEVSIQVERPSRSASPEDTESMYSSPSPRLPPVHGTTQSLSTHHQHPSSESVNSSAASSYTGRRSFWMSGADIGASQGRSSQESVTSPSTQDPPIPFPEPSVPPIPTPISTTNAPNSLPQPRTPSFGLMTSEQVSRYSKKGDVYVLSMMLANIYCDIHSGQGKRAGLYWHRRRLIYGRNTLPPGLNIS